MFILGLNVGHNATACLLKDGKIVNCVQEERFSRTKNHAGVPFKSISFILKENKISINDIDLIVLDDHYSAYEYADFGKSFLEDYTKKTFKKRLLSGLGYKYPNLFRFYSKIKESLRSSNKPVFINNLKSNLSQLLKFPRDKILIIGHHHAHALSPCFNLPRNKKTLVFTLDGEGSGISGTVGVFDGRNFKVISRTKKSASLGYLYSIATIYLGMKPLEHEFKVMGLAPYAKTHNVEKVYSKFKELIWVDSKLRFQSKFNMPFADSFFSKEMKFVRFDVVAAAVQKLTEELICDWISKAIKKTGINNIAVSGGVFMNVKAVMEASKLSEVSSLFVMPSAGDESNPFGCCFFGYEYFCRNNNLNFAPKPFTHLYLGPEYSDSYIENLFKEKNLSEKYKILKPKSINKEIARLLAKGEIVARCSGKSEWGARALGNRSILANPKHPDTIRILNETIKDRDFWMPFTPSVLDKFGKKYLINKKRIFSPYMVITFDSTKLAQEKMPAAMHPYDFTVRPQIVTKSFNPDYYELIEAFAKLTGTGAILNTSFNLHGEPNVLTPEDALRTVENSGLKYLALGKYLLEKRDK